MQILVFSMAPVFRNHVHGGSQKILREVLRHIGMNHRITVLCTKREDNEEEFELFDNVAVKPRLPFKQTYPEPYYTAPYNLATAIETIKKEMDNHDVLYIHDSEMNFFILHRINKPIIASLREFVYPDTLLGAFNFRRDVVIVNSEFTKESVRYTIGRYMPEINERIIVIPNGINTNLFRRVKPNKVFGYIPRIEGNNIILYPHRPDERKGIYPVLQVVSRLKHKLGVKDIRLLVPVYVDMNVSEGEKSYYGVIHYEKIRDAAGKMDVLENVVFHKWVPYELMPEYYSLGRLTLCIGSFVEGFGCNVSLESICCDTPVIVSRVGAKRTTLPDELVPKVEYGDLSAVEGIALKILRQGADLSGAKEFIKQRYSYKGMLERYEKVITDTKTMPGMRPRFRALNMNRCVFRLPPWCYLGEKGIYNDYRYGYSEENHLSRLLRRNKKFTLDDALAEGLSEKVVRDCINKGDLVCDVN
jgi:glycosyltransferase involved in cell wall biosynthesis